jgi:arylsulfatase A-like enzyme
LIVADDMGYGDCGVQGCRDIPTPNLDALAAGGVRFTDGYVSGSVCSPSRAALMTGRYQQRDGVLDWVKPGGPGLSAGVPTLADYLKKSGYRTALVGKWHLGEQEDCHPLNRGFDDFFGFLGGGRSYFPEAPRGAQAKVNHYTQLVRGREPVAEKDYLTQAFGREAAAFISRQAKEGPPFFLYLAFNAVHTPLQATEEYRLRFAAISDPKRRTYAAMLSAMDDAIGRVLKAVHDAQLDESTLICFISDNGGPITRNAPNSSGNGPLRGGKGETWEGGIRVPFFMKWSGHLKGGTTFQQPVIQMDLTATALALAGATVDPKWPIDGVNLLPFLNGGGAMPHPTLYWDCPTNGKQWAIRQGNWKLTCALPERTSKLALGLYDLSQDIGESRDLSGEHPERVHELHVAWTEWQKGLRTVMRPAQPLHVRGEQEGATKGLALDYQSAHLAIALSSTQPAFSSFSVDSLGLGKFTRNPVLSNTQSIMDLKRSDQTYLLNGKSVWSISCSEKVLLLQSDVAEGVDVPPFTLTFDQKANHATLLGLMKPGERKMALPCLLHLPDMGTLRITCNVPGAMLEYDARRFVKPTPFVSIGFPAATVRQPRIEYRMEVVSIYPKLKGVEDNPLYDGFRRDWLNIFQVNPRLQMLANNASSDPCAFTLFTYSDVARHTPPLAEGLTANDLVRMTLDQYLAGMLGYGQIGYGCTPSEADIISWKTPWRSLDSLPSFLIAACNYVQGSRDEAWGRANYAKLAVWGREMFADDKNGNGLIEYLGTGNYGDRPQSYRRPANWWDTINFGHEDAFGNALAYRAATMFAELAKQLKHDADAQFFADKAAKLRAAYAPTFLNPATGLLAGWKSADGQLHDYAFTFVQGMAITFGLLDDKTANSVMDRLLAKMKAVGYTRFDLGLPGNLVPVKREDYVYHATPPEVHGVPKLEDGSDGFQYYENGGATACWSYYTVKALYQLGRVADARSIFHPMLQGYARGEFQGFGENGMSRDWRDWKGGCHGYEGLLVDNYHALLAVLEDEKAPLQTNQEKAK